MTYIIGYKDANGKNWWMTSVKFELNTAHSCLSHASVDINEAHKFSSVDEAETIAGLLGTYQEQTYEIFNLHPIREISIGQAYVHVRNGQIELIDKKCNLTEENFTKATQWLDRLAVKYTVRCDHELRNRRGIYDLNGLIEQGEIPTLFKNINKQNNEIRNSRKLRGQMYTVHMSM